MWCGSIRVYGRMSIYALYIIVYNSVCRYGIYSVYSAVYNVCIIYNSIYISMSDYVMMYD